MFFQIAILTRILETHVKDMLTMMMAECSDAFEMLPAVDNADILRNILYSGVWNSYERRVFKKFTKQIIFYCDVLIFQN